MSLIGLSGSHRTGKTTTKNLLLERLGNHYSEVPFSISREIHRMGYDPSNLNYPLSIRMQIQEGLFQRMAQILQARQGLIKLARIEYGDRIADRTPLDLAAYAMTVPEYSEEKAQWLDDYIVRCINLTNAYFDKILLFSPTNVPYVYDQKSASEDTRDYVHDLLCGVANNPLLKVPVKYVRGDTIEQRYASVLGNIYEYI